METRACVNGEIPTISKFQVRVSGKPWNPPLRWVDMHAQRVTPQSLLKLRCMQIRLADSFWLSPSSSNKVKEPSAPANTLRRKLCGKAAPLAIFQRPAG